MLHWLPSSVLFVINVTLLVLSTFLITVLLTVIALIKKLFCGAFRIFFTTVSNRIFRMWLYSVAFVINLTNDVKWHIQQDFVGNKQDSYLVMSNHISWLDTLIVVAILCKDIPVPKFFLKHSLLYVPLVGASCWALDMPFLHRYSREYLLKHPNARTKDIETTQKSCAKFKDVPTTMINFVEGTRYTPQKAVASHSPYQYLMTPKAMSFSLAMEHLGVQFAKIINLTLAYPDNKVSPFKDMLLGRLKRVYVIAEEIPVTDNLRGSYLTDKTYKRSFTLWLKGIWQVKDKLLSEIYPQKNNNQ